MQMVVAIAILPSVILTMVQEGYPMELRKPSATSLSNLLISKQAVVATTYSVTIASEPTTGVFPPTSLKVPLV